MRPIDADALLDFLDVGHLRPPTEICFSELMMKNIIDIQPTVDAVPVIRCKDCKYYRYEIDMCDEPCSTAHNVVHEDDYCSRAVRKEE